MLLRKFLEAVMWGFGHLRITAVVVGIVLSFSGCGFLQEDNDAGSLDSPQTTHVNIYHGFLLTSAFSSYRIMVPDLTFV